MKEPHMTETNNRKVFEFTYSALKQEEIERIRNKYLPKQESKMEQHMKKERNLWKRKILSL